MNGLFPTICQKNVVNFYWAIWLNDYLKTFFHRVEEVSTKKKFKSNLENLFLVIFPIFNFILFHVTRLLLCPFKRHNGLKSYKLNLEQEFYYSNRRQLNSNFSEKATKSWKNLPLVLTLLSKNCCFVKARIQRGGVILSELLSSSMKCHICGTYLNLNFRWHLTLYWTSAGSHIDPWKIYLHPPSWVLQ